MVEGLIKHVTCKEMVIATTAIKLGKASEPSKVCVKMILASGKVGIGVTMEPCQCVLDKNEYQINDKRVC